MEYQALGNNLIWKVGIITYLQKNQMRTLQTANYYNKIKVIKSLFNQWAIVSTLKQSFQT